MKQYQYAGIVALLAFIASNTSHSLAGTILFAAAGIVSFIHYAIFIFLNK